MRIMIKIKYHIFIYFSLFIFLNSCYKEDMSDCYDDDFNLSFSLIMNKYKFENIVDNLVLYQYDDKGELLEEYEFSRKQLESDDFIVKLPLPAKGIYTFVAIANINDTFHRVYSKDKRGDFLLRLITKEFSVTDKIDDIYQGYKQIIIDDEEEVPRTENIELTKHTNNITVIVETTDSEPENNPEFSTTISGTNGVYNYRYQPLPSEIITYIPHESVFKRNSLSLTDQYRIMRIWIDDDMKLGIFNKDADGNKKEISSIMLTAAIADMKDMQGNLLYNTDEKLEQEDEFEIHVLLKPDGETYAVAEIWVNGWMIVINPGVIL